MIVEAALVLVTLLLVGYFSYFHLISKPHPKFPPGPWRWPVWGGYLQLLVENYRFPHKAIHNMARRYNTEVVGMYMGAYPVVIACTHASVKDMLTKPEFQGRADAFIIKKRDEDGIVRGQVFVDGHLWAEQRRFMLRSLREFGFGTRNKRFEGIVEEEVKDFIDVVQSDVKGVCHKGEVCVPVVFYAYFINLSLQVLLGTRLPPEQHHKLRELAFKALGFLEAIDATTGLLNLTPWVRYFAPDVSGYNTCVDSSEALKNFIKELVQEHKNTFIAEALRDYSDVFLNEQMEKNKSDVPHKYSEEQMIMSLWDMLFATSMTVTATMGFLIQFLLYYPELQTKVQQEIDRVVGSGRLPTLDDRQNLPYTEAFMREVMRRETMAVLALPHRCTEDTYFYDYFIPKDTVVLASIYSAHMDEKVWENPLEFKPERHLDENGTLTTKDLTMPFGKGRRVCSSETFARQNMFMLMSAMLQQFRVELPEGHSLPDMALNLPGIITSPSHFTAKFVPR